MACDTSFLKHYHTPVIHFGILHFKNEETLFYPVGPISRYSQHIVIIIIIYLHITCFTNIFVFVLYCFGSYPVLVMGVVPSLMGNVCVYVCM